MISLSGGQVLYRNTEVYEVDAKRELIKIISSIKLLQRITSHNSCVRSTSLGLRHIAAKGRRNVSYASRYMQKAQKLFNGHPWAHNCRLTC